MAMPVELDPKRSFEVNQICKRTLPTESSCSLNFDTQTLFKINYELSAQLKQKQTAAKHNT